MVGHCGDYDDVGAVHRLTRWHQKTTFQGRPINFAGRGVYPAVVGCGVWKQPVPKGNSKPFSGGSKCGVRIGTEDALSGYDISPVRSSMSIKELSMASVELTECSSATQVRGNCRIP
jgi:hypothetical protein